jgi:hypothetical protein
MALGESNPCQFFGNAANGRNATVKFVPNKYNTCQQAMKLTKTQFQRRSLRINSKQISRSSNGTVHSIQNHFELSEETESGHGLACEPSPLLKPTPTRLFNVMVKTLKGFFIRLVILLWLHFPFTH